MFDFKVEIKRGPAPDSSKLLGGDKKTGVKESAAYRVAQAVAARLALQQRPKGSVVSSLGTTASSSTLDDGRKPKDPDATDFHAIIPINDYPQKARWRVTNKETMVQSIIVDNEV